MAVETPQVEPLESPVDDREGFLVRTPYHQGFVSDLKEEIPTRDRRWLADSKGWWVSEDHEEDLGFLLERYFDVYERVDPDTGEVEMVGRGR